MKYTRAQLSVAIGISGAVHGALLWAAIASSWGGAAQPWVEPPAIQLVRIQGGETDNEKGEAAPPPAPKTAPRAPTEIANPAPPTVTAKPVEPSPIPAPKAAIQPAAAPPTEPAATQDQSAVVPAAAKAQFVHPPNPQRAGETAGLNVNAPRGKSQDYASMLRVWLEAHKTYPKHARMRRQEGVVQIRFAVDRQGHLLDGVIVRSSGVASLDQEALAMLDRSNPFPAAPHTVRGERIELRTPVEFFLR